MTTSSDTQPQQQEGPERPARIWMRAEVLDSPELREHFVKLNPDDIEYVRADLPRATTEAELTVESALRELREMFSHWKYFALTESIGAPRKRYWLKLGPAFYSADVFNIWGETLEELMNQVRAWSKSHE